MTAAEAEAALVERARVERLIRHHIRELSVVARSTHSTRADDARAGMRALNALLVDVDGGEHHAPTLTLVDVEVP